MLIKMLSLVLIGIILYRMLARFVLPLFVSSVRTESRLKNVEDELNRLSKKPANASTQRKEGDFIEYEELK